MIEYFYQGSTAMEVEAYTSDLGCCVGEVERKRRSFSKVRYDEGQVGSDTLWLDLLVGTVEDGQEQDSTPFLLTIPHIFLHSFQAHYRRDHTDHMSKAVLRIHESKYLAIPDKLPDSWTEHLLPADTLADEAGDSGRNSKGMTENHPQGNVHGRVDSMEVKKA
jgi:hypothetical protein